MKKNSASAEEKRPAKRTEGKQSLQEIARSFLGQQLTIGLDLGDPNESLLHLECGWGGSRPR
jgi:hypothetical protein